MSEIRLPLSEYFIEIFKTYEIRDWEAKDFWSIIRESNNLDSSKFIKIKEDMYSAIKILKKNGYLIAKKSPFNKNIYFYTEGEKIKEFRMNLLESEKSNSLIIKKGVLVKELDNCKKATEFMDDLLLTCPDFNDKIQEYRAKINQKINDYELKIQTIDNIIKLPTE